MRPASRLMAAKGDATRVAEVQNTRQQASPRQWQETKPSTNAGMQAAAGASGRLPHSGAVRCNVRRVRRNSGASCVPSAARSAAGKQPTTRRSAAMSPAARTAVRATYAAAMVTSKRKKTNRKAGGVQRRFVFCPQQFAVRIRSSAEWRLSVSLRPQALQTRVANARSPFARSAVAYAARQQSPQLPPVRQRATGARAMRA